MVYSVHRLLMGSACRNLADSLAVMYFYIYKQVLCLVVRCFINASLLVLCVTINSVDIAGLSD